MPTSSRARKGKAGVRPAVLLALLLLPAALAAAPSAAASPPPAVEATFVLSQPTLGSVDLLGVLLVHAHAVDGRETSAAEIARSASADGSSPAIAALQEAARQQLADALVRAYPTSRVHVGVPTLDGASLEAARAGAAPLKLTLGALVERPRDELGLGALSDDAVAAALAAGARWETPLALPAPPRHAVTYVLRAPAFAPGLGVLAASPGTVDAGDATILVDNRDGGALRVDRATVTVGDLAARAPAVEDVAQRVDLVFGPLAPNATSVTLDVTLALEVRALDVSDTFPGLLPESVTLPYVSADGLRTLHAAGVFGARELAFAEERLFARLGPTMEATLPGATPTGGLAPGTLDATGTPLRFVAHASGAHALPGAHARHAELALALGGVLHVDVPLAVGADAMTFVLHAPPGTRFAGAAIGALSDDDATLMLHAPPGASGSRAALALRDADVFAARAAHASVDVRADVADVVVPLSSPAGAELRGDVTVRVDVRALAVPPELREAMGDRVELSHVTSDGLRLLVARGVLDEAQLLAAFGSEAEGAAERALGAPLTNARTEALGLRMAPSSPPSDDEPVVLVLRGGFAKPVAGASPQPQAAIALYTQQQAFDLPRMQGAETRYTLILPEGLSLAGLAVVGGDERSWQEAGGRDAFSVRPGAEGAHVVATLALTPGFLVAHFAPALAGGALALAGMVLAPLLLARRRRAR